jgi:hypothetical protein
VPYKHLLPEKKEEKNFKLINIFNTISISESARDVYYALCCYNCEIVKEQKEICCPAYTAVGTNK